MRKHLPTMAPPSPATAPVAEPATADPGPNGLAIAAAIKAKSTKINNFILMIFFCQRSQSNYAFSINFSVYLYKCFVGRVFFFFFILLAVLSQSQILNIFFFPILFDKLVEQHNQHNSKIQIDCIGNPLMEKEIFLNKVRRIRCIFIRDYFVISFFF